MQYILLEMAPTAPLSQSASTHHGIYWGVMKGRKFCNTIAIYGKQAELRRITSNTFDASIPLPIRLSKTGKFIGSF